MPLKMYLINMPRLPRLSIRSNMSNLPKGTILFHLTFLLLAWNIFAQNLPNCGIRGSQNLPNGDLGIINGVDAILHEFPWMGSLQVFTPNDSVSSSHLCGLSILNARWLLTAAHCVDPANTGIAQDQLRVVLSKY